MKRPRSYGDDLDVHLRRRFYDRPTLHPPPPPPPQRRWPEQDGDIFDRRKGYDHRYRNSPSPRGSHGGGVRAMHRSESFAGFRRDFPKGFRSERDRQRRDGGGSGSAWRRSGGGSGGRECEDLDGHRWRPRRSELSASVPASASVSAMAGERRDQSRRLEIGKVERTRKESSISNEMEEGEVAPDPVPAKREPFAAAHAMPARHVGSEKEAEVSYLKEANSEGVNDKGVEASDRKPADLEKGVSLGTDGKQENDGDCGGYGDGAAKEQERINNVVVEDADIVKNRKHEGGSINDAVVMEDVDEAMDRHKEGRIGDVMMGDVDKATYRQDKEGRISDAVAEDVAKVTNRQREEGRIGDAVVEDADKMTDIQLEEGRISDAVTDNVDKAMDRQHTEGNIGDAVVGDVDRLMDTQDKQIILEVGGKRVSKGEGRERDEAVIVDDQSRLSEEVQEVSWEEERPHVSSHGPEAKELEKAAVIDEGQSRKSEPLALRPIMGELKVNRAPHGPEAKEAEKAAMVDEEQSKKIESPASHPVTEELEVNEGKVNGSSAKTEAVSEKETATEHEVEKKLAKDFDLEAEPDGITVLLQSVEVDVGESKSEDTTLNLMAEKPKVDDKGKGVAFEVLSKEDNSDEDSPCREGSSGRGFDLAFRPDVGRSEASQCVGTSSAKQQDDELTMGTLDLSLSLPGSLQNSEIKCLPTKPDSPTRTLSCQSLPSSSFHTTLDGSTASMSFTNSQTFVHNPSCSLTQQTLDNYEHSVGSKPIFQAVEQMGNGTMWQAQLSNEAKQKGGAAALLQRELQNGHASHNAFASVNGQHHGMPNALQRQGSSPSLIYTTQSHSDIRDGQLTRASSSSSLFRSRWQEGEQLVLNGTGVIEGVISKIVSEPSHLTGRMLQEMTEHSVAYLREAISETVTTAHKTRQIIALQETLNRRSDLTREMLQKCPRVLLQMLVTIKTGLPDFIKKNSSIATSDLVEIFLNLKCRNLACRSMLPVDDCDCKICQQKSGFCSSCMCIVCSNFDMASNTCSWVGCDVCLHWCHTDCGLRHALIRKGGGGSQAYGTNEMQFNCAACGHPSEMFGFVKEVFTTCAKEWKVDTLVRELQCVVKIFSSSDDVRGKRLKNFANQMLLKLEDRTNHSEVVKYVIAFLSDGGSNVDNTSSVPLKSTQCITAEASNRIPSSTKETTWLPSVPLEKVPFLVKASVLSMMDDKQVVSQIGGSELQVIEKRPAVDELDSLVRFKLAEAKMYQERANDARKEAESLKHIVMAKKAKIEADYGAQAVKLCIGEAEERRKLRLEELRAVERAHQQYFNMKMRMEADIRELLLKMEASKHNLST